MIPAVLILALSALEPTVPSDTIRNEHIDEVVVKGHSAVQRLQTVQMGVERLGREELAATPSLFGEHDVMRQVQLLPGVKQESEASSGFQVRGGTSAQNAIFYDHVPVYNVGHLAGLFSAFNSDAIMGATLYKGCPPPQFGGGTSAVLDVSSRAAATDTWHGAATVGLLSAKAMAEGPFAKGKGGLLVSARRSYADVPLKLIKKFRDNTFYFYDVNARADYDLGPADQLQLSFFGGKDRTALEDMVDMEWHNLALNLSWRHHFQGDAYSETSLLLSDYATDNGIDMLGMDLSFSGNIRQWGLRHHASTQLGPCSLDFGGQSMVVSVTTGEWQQLANHEKEQRRAWENALWAGLEWPVLPSLTVQAGLRLGSFSSLGGPYYYDVDEQGNISWYYKTRRYHIVNTHFSVDPRLSLRWQLLPQLSLKGGYSHSTQNIHALRGQNTSTPFDRYTLSSNLLKPQQAHQLSLGLYAMTPRQDYDLSLEAYYRHINNILDYRDGKSFGSAIEMERLVLPGQGRCYGAELMVRKNHGRLSGWLAYTLAWAKNKIPGINGGRWYTAGVDRRHDLDLVAIYSLSPQWKLSAVWVYNSGQAFTAPSGKYEMIDNYIYYYAERNGYRAPDYHRLDVSATWTKTIAHGRLTREWQFGIYNLYNRYNPFLINFEDSEHGARTKAMGYSLFGIVPSASLTIKF